MKASESREYVKKDSSLFIYKSLISYLFDILLGTSTRFYVFEQYMQACLECPTKCERREQ